MNPARAAGPPAGWALFLDFDGTLVEIAPRPDAVVVPPDVPDTLGKLRRRLDGAVAIVTGRASRDVDHFFPGMNLDLCGLHGLDRRVGGVPLPPDGLVRPEREIAEIQARLGAVPGIVIEDKGLGVAVHWRLAPAMEREVIGLVDALAGRLGPGFRVQDGKMVREILPARAGKGGGIRALMDLPPYRGRRPVFAGDDTTDEHGFEAVNELGGLSVKIGPGATAARIRLGTAAGFRDWLADWADGRSAPDRLPV